jgi:hypothetical protein
MVLLRYVFLSICLLGFGKLYSQETKNELGVSLLSYNNTIYSFRKIDNIIPLSGVTYKRDVGKHFKARALVGFESGAYVFPEFDLDCADCGRRSFSSKTTYFQAGVQYSYKYKFIEPYVYADLRYLRSKEYSEYVNYAFGRQDWSERRTINGFGTALGAGVQVHVSDRISITYEPSIIWQKTYSSGNGVYNDEPKSWNNVKEAFFDYRAISVFSVNVGF